MGFLAEGCGGMKDSSCNWMRASHGGAIHWELHKAETPVHTHEFDVAVE